MLEWEKIYLTLTYNTVHVDQFRNITQVLYTVYYCGRLCAGYFLFSFYRVGL